MNVERIAIADLSFDPANARKHGERNLAAITASLRRFGQQTPIVIDKSNVVRKGNGTLQAAISMGWDSIDCIRTELTSSDAIAYAIADNRTSELAEWDDDVLAAQLNGLLTDDPDLLDAAGFDEDELAALLGDLDDEEPGEITEDEVPEPPVDPITKPGDLWILGRHRLLCGDSTKAEDVARLMDGEKADIVFTDPPYGVSVLGGKNNSSIAGDISQVAIPFSFDLACTVATKDDARLYFCGAETNIGMYAKLFERFCRQSPRHLIWVKNGFVMKPNGYHNQYEVIFHGYKPRGGGLNKWFAGRTEHEASDIWRINRDPSSSYEHPTQKPVALPARAIANSCQPDGIVYEPFCGSGSTLIAAEQLGRTCYGMEISPQYCDVIVNRWENLTGEKAVCQSKKPE